ncbi:probable inactive peptidyl-prolyl cis-trans isomerase-like 6 [Anneissia japonica]|uniref:probable inactive peptidyl-prolyl cis-trans isomerase-like 6 n=1 Tax=Anneissia japonica TaxID=1529436 RepID=UPI001425A80C|nr:probable inactive peptidyl-prolyl cis-trans isomerase-like 6 [Anneissia japonica]
MYLEKQKKELKGEMWAFEYKAVAYVNGILIGGPVDLLKWAMEEWQYTDYRPETLYEALSAEAYNNYLVKTEHTFVFLEVSIGSEPAGKLVFELYTDKCPKTCENFRALCTGEKGEKKDESLMPYHYKNSILHRIVPSGWIQGGDILNGVGTGGESIYGPFFEDENFSVPHASRGMLGMANQGRHTNASQFYITLQPAPWMNTKYVAFGKLVEGTHLLATLENQETYNERPKKECKITDCGVLELDR